MLTFILSLSLPLLLLVCIVFFNREKIFGPSSSSKKSLEQLSSDSSVSSSPEVEESKKKKPSSISHGQQQQHTDKVHDVQLIVEASTLKKKNTQHINDDDVIDLAVSRNYTAILKKSEKTIRLYRNELLVKDNKKFQDIEIGTINDYGTSIALTEEGDYLAVSIDYDNFIRIFKLSNSANNQQIIHEKPINLPAEKKMIKSMKFSPNGKYLFAQLDACDDISIYNLSTNQVEKIKTGQLENYMFTLNDSYMCVAGFASVVKVFKTFYENATATSNPKKKEHHSNIHLVKGNTSNVSKYRELSGCKSSVINVDNYQHLIITTTSKDETVRLFNADENEHYIEAESPIANLAPSIGNFKQVFICSENVFCGIGSLNNEIVFFERCGKSFKLIHLIEHATLNKTPILKACLNPKRKVLLTTSADGYLRMWKVPDHHSVYSK